MLATQSAEVAPIPTNRAVSAKMLRQWCAPEVILVVTNLADETIILPHAIKHARQNRAKIVLAHVTTADEALPMCRKPPLPHPRSRLQVARSIVERMARQLRWLGFTCEPLVLAGHPDSAIPLIARNHCVDRVIVALDNDPFPGPAKTLAYWEQPLPKLDIPTCVISRHVSVATSGCLRTRNITLAVSLESDCDVPLAFACRFAQELQATLTILHVASNENRNLGNAATTPREVASRLPDRTWQEAKLFCPTEIEVREGEAAEEILKHAASTHPDFMILCSPGSSAPGSDWRTSVSGRVMENARCPIFLLQEQRSNASSYDALVQAPKAASAYAESAESTLGGGVRVAL